MLRVNIYISEDINKKLEFVAKTKGLKKAQIVRFALEVGLKALHPKSLTAKNLLSLAKIAEKIPTKGYVPKDLIKNLDYYTWSGKKNA